MIIEVVSHAPVAQLDRARASDARCRKFESCQVHFLYSKKGGENMEKKEGNNILTNYKFLMGIIIILLLVII